MIKIIKHGHEQYRMTCKYCECLFSFEDEDIHNNGSQRDWEEWVVCPECKRNNMIKDRSIFQSYKIDFF